MRENASKSRLVWWMLMSLLLLLGMLFFPLGLVRADDGSGGPLIQDSSKIEIEGSIEGEIFTSSIGPLYGGNILFQQPPTPSDQDCIAYTSDAIMGFLCLEDFLELTSDIDDIHWYGFSLVYDYDLEEWYECDVSGMQFEIIFYRDAGGYPGAQVAKFSNISPTIEYYDTYYVFPAYRFDVPSLGMPVGLTEGWVSIQSTFSPNGCAFLWLDSPVGDLNAIQQGGMDNDNIEDNLSFSLTKSVRIVGGEFYQENKILILAPWIALGIVILAGGVYLIRRTVRS